MKKPSYETIILLRYFYMKYSGTRYNSRWDGSTFFILALVSICCIIPCFTDDGIAPVIIALLVLAFTTVAFASIYYRIDGDQLIIYTFFIPTAYPIKKIKEIRPTKSVISAPASSLTHRIAISFIDRTVLKSSMPIIISPARQEEFLSQLKSINPDIVVDINS